MKKIFIFLAIFCFLNADDSFDIKSLEKLGQELQGLFDGKDFNKTVDEFANIAKSIGGDIDKVSNKMADFLKNNEENIQELIKGGEKIAKDLNSTFNQFEKEFKNLSKDKDKILDDFFKSLNSPIPNLKDDEVIDKTKSNTEDEINL